MINLSDKSISELEQVVINYENEEFELPSEGWNSSSYN